jgi:hypothetical protein
MKYESRHAVIFLTLPLDRPTQSSQIFPLLHVDGQQIPK